MREIALFVLDAFWYFWCCVFILVAVNLKFARERRYYLNKRSLDDSFIFITNEETKKNNYLVFYLIFICIQLKVIQCDL